MKMIFIEKRIVLFTALLGLLALVLLTGSLKSMDFLPGMPFGGTHRIDPRLVIDVKKIITEVGDVPLWKEVAVWVGFFIMIVLISFLLTPELRKKLIRDFIRLTIFLIGMLYLIRNHPELITQFFSQFPNPAGSDHGQGQVNLAPPVFEPPRISHWLAYVIALGITLLLVMILVRIFVTWKHAREFSSGGEPIKEIAKVVHASLRDLGSGREVENRIIDCYVRMNRVVDDRRGLHRESAMTPSEFASRLTRAGLPQGSVERLTHLFEVVRYGGRDATQAEIDDAIDSLSSILKYCGETR